MILSPKMAKNVDISLLDFGFKISEFRIQILDWNLFS